MDLKDLYWTAGFLEGEGYFCLRGSTKSAVTLNASQVQRHPLDHLVALWGGKVLGPYQNKNPKSSPYYRWDLSGTNAVALMMTLYSLLSPKRQEAIRSIVAIWRVNPGNPATWVARGFCKNGHDLTGSNYVVAPSGHGRCRECGIQGRRRYYAAHREKWTLYALQRKQKEA
jgi:hypothetical protein